MMSYYADYLLIATCCLLLATCYLPLTTCYLLLAACYLLLAACYVLSAWRLVVGARHDENDQPRPGAPEAWGCCLWCTGLQPLIHGVAASNAWGCSL